MAPSYVSLFSGCGGFDIGFDAAGFRCVAQVEIDKTARAVLGRHWPDVPRYEDVRQFGAAQVRYVDPPPAVTCGGGKPGEGHPAVQIGATVRRLTHRECERLMGWPDDFTRWREDGTEIADGPRYRLCGNGVVGTVSGWLARRMMAVMTGGEA